MFQSGPQVQKINGILQYLQIEWPSQAVLTNNKHPRPRLQYIFTKIDSYTWRTTIKENILSLQPRYQAAILVVNTIQFFAEFA